MEESVLSRPKSLWYFKIYLFQSGEERYKCKSLEFYWEEEEEATSDVDCILLQTGRSLPWEGSGQRNENFFNTSRITLQLSTAQSVYGSTRNIIYSRYLNYSLFPRLFYLGGFKAFFFTEEILFKNITWEPWDVVG